MTEPNNGFGPGAEPGPNPLFSQNGASSDSAVGSLGGGCGSCSLRSSLRTTSARMDHDVIFAAFDFLPLPFGCSQVELTRIKADKRPTGTGSQVPAKSGESTHPGQHGARGSVCQKNSKGNCTEPLYSSRSPR